MPIKEHVVYEDNIDNRMLKCACGAIGCKIGVNFDSEPDIMLLTDKYGNEHAMHIDKENARELIKILKQWC